MISEFNNLDNTTTVDENVSTTMTVFKVDVDGNVDYSIESTNLTGTVQISNCT